VVDVSARTDAETAGHMTWDITDLGFKMGLSRQVPDVLAVHVGPMVEDLLGRNGVERDEVAGWAVHPGGPRILDVIGEQLDLAATDLAGSRHVLAEHGNCSSATVLLVLDELVHARVAEPVATSWPWPSGRASRSTPPCSRWSNRAAQRLVTSSVARASAPTSARPRRTGRAPAWGGRAPPPPGRRAAGPRTKPTSR